MPSKTQRQIITELCAVKPMTIEDMQEELPGANYHTVYRVVRDLLDKKILEELPFRRDKKILFQATGREYKGTLRVQIHEKMKPVAHMAFITPQDYPVGVASIVAFLWRRAFLRTQPEGELSQTWVPPLEAKRDLVAIRGSLKNLLAVIEQLLVLPIWEDTDGLHERMGLLDVASQTKLMERAQMYIDSKKEK